MLILRGVKVTVKDNDGKYKNGMLIKPIPMSFGGEWEILIEGESIPRVWDENYIYPANECLDSRAKEYFK